jgi:predicted nucleotidyltransferase
MAQCYHDIYGADIVGIFLYGSYARGDYDNQSDIDIAAIVKGSRLDLQNKLKAVWDISADIGLENDVVVSPTVIPYDEFEEYKEKLPSDEDYDRGQKGCKGNIHVGGLNLQLCQRQRRNLRGTYVGNLSVHRRWPDQHQVPATLHG